MKPPSLVQKLKSKVMALHPSVMTVDGHAFHPHRRTELCHIMNACGSDKGAWHNYTTLYSVLFSPSRNERLRVFELGMGTNNTDVASNMGEKGVPGASLRGWKKFFPNAAVFGADIDARILFQEERIKTFQCDQTDPESIKRLWAHEELREEFDIIIEDGLHELQANKCFFENSIHKLRKGGFYIAEDLARSLGKEYAAYFEAMHRQDPNLRMELVDIPSLIPDEIENILWIAQKS